MSPSFSSSILSPVHSGSLWTRSFALSPHVAMLSNVQSSGPRSPKGFFYSGKHHSNVKIQSTSTRSDVLSNDSLDTNASPYSITQNALQASHSHCNDIAKFNKYISTYRSWNYIESYAEPIAILSSEYPHVIMKCSHAWSALLRMSNETSFAMYLEQFLDISSNDIDIDKEYSNLNDFYFGMYTNGYSHAILSLKNGEGDSVKMSIHSKAVIRDNISLAEEKENSSHDSSKNEAVENIDRKVDISIK